jgi:1-acyl-sn-glycerol-3-phosphate acyltransferase
LIRTLASIWLWLAVALLAVVCFVAQLLLAPLTWPWDPERRVTGRLFRVLCGVLPARLCPLWRFGIKGTTPRELPPRVVVVSNHESDLDPFLISWLPWEMKWLSKSSLFKIPFAGWCMSLAGDIPVLRGERESAAAALAKCRRYLESGMPVMIFPEGTRSRTSELLPFKEGAFRLAIQTRASVLPIAVNGTRQALPKHSWRITPARAWVAVGEPIPTEGLTEADLPALSAAAREQIERLRR